MAGMMSGDDLARLDATQGTEALLACGLVAGPLFTTVALVQVLTRDGFDLATHPLSLLSLGDLGWVQISNFVATGMLSVAFAVGMRRALPSGRSGAWASGLYAAFGLGMVAGGVFVTDPSLGFPPASFDAALSRWGIIFEPDAEAAAVRVDAPGVVLAHPGAAAFQGTLLLLQQGG